MSPPLDASAALAERVRHRLVDAGEDVAFVIADEVALLASDSAAEPLGQDLRDELLGLGPLQQFLDDPEIEEMWINSPDHVFIARAGVSERVHVSLTSESIRGLVERMLRPTGRRIDMAPGCSSRSRISRLLPPAPSRRLWWHCPTTGLMRPQHSSALARAVIVRRPGPSW